MAKYYETNCGIGASIDLESMKRCGRRNGYLKEMEGEMDLSEEEWIFEKILYGTDFHGFVWHNKYGGKDVENVFIVVNNPLEDDAKGLQDKIHSLEKFLAENDLIYDKIGCVCGLVVS